MPAYFSRAVYAEPWDSLGQVKQKAKSHGNFPKVARSSVEVLHEQLRNIQKNKELNVMQARRKALDDGRKYKLETEPAVQDMRQGRAPGILRPGRQDGRSCPSGAAIHKRS